MKNFIKCLFFFRKYRRDKTTHINLGVTEKADGWPIFLRNLRALRMAATIRTALALEKEGLPGIIIHQSLLLAKAFPE